MHAILSFLEQLEAHNTVERMHAHQPEYKTAKTTLEQLAQTMIDQISSFDRTIGELYPAETIFRLAKDTRFSKDKSPYKTNMGIVIAPWGKKSIFPCYYIHLQPGNRSFLACWLYRPESNVQKAVRDRLVTDRQGFEKILTAIAKTWLRWPLEGDNYKRVPAWYDKEHPASELIKYKDRLITTPLLDKQINDPSFINETISCFHTIYLFNEWLHNAIINMIKEQV
jgi:uncharacterized protein (TIGR02453 family)